MAKKIGSATPDDSVSEEQTTRPPRSEFVRWAGETLALQTVLTRTGGFRVLPDGAGRAGLAGTESATLEPGAEYRAADLPKGLLEWDGWTDVEIAEVQA